MSSLTPLASPSPSDVNTNSSSASTVAGSPLGEGQPLPNWSPTEATAKNNSSVLDGSTSKATESPSPSISVPSSHVSYASPPAPGSQISTASPVPVSQASAAPSSGVVDLSGSQSTWTYESAPSYLSAPDMFMKSLPPRINVTPEDDEEDEEDVVDVPQCRGNRNNFCSDLMDFEVGMLPTDGLMLKFPTDAGDGADDEFVPSPIPVTNKPSETDLTSSSSSTSTSPQPTSAPTSTSPQPTSAPMSATSPARSDAGRSISQLSHTTKSPGSQTNPQQLPANVMVPTTLPNGLSPDAIFAAAVQQTIPQVASMNVPTADWLLTSGMAARSALTPLQQQTADAMILQANIVEMQRLQQELQRSFVLSSTQPPQQMDYPRLEAENFLLNQQAQQSSLMAGALGQQQQSHFMNQTIQDPSIWANQLGNSSPSNASSIPEQKTPLTTAQAAATALSRLPSLEFAQTVTRCKELVLSSTSKLDAAYASSSYGANEGSSSSTDPLSGTNTMHPQIVQLLADAIEGMSSALFCISPGYLDMIAEGRCNTTKRPMMLAHPDEFKNPSSFLKIYGDPQCNTRGGTPSHPRRGRDGNWECRSCGNVNYPRRFRCNNSKCKALRDAEGDRLVSEYARQVFHLYLPQSKSSNNNNANNSNRIPAPPSTPGAAPIDFDHAGMMHGAGGYSLHGTNTNNGRVHRHNNHSSNNSNFGHNHLNQSQQMMLHQQHQPPVHPSTGLPTTPLHHGLLYGQDAASVMGLNNFQAQMMAAAAAAAASNLPISRSEIPTPSRSSTTNPGDHSPAVSSATSVRSGRGGFAVNSPVITDDHLSNFFF